MATPSGIDPQVRAEALAAIRAAQERNAVRRERVQRYIAKLGRIAEQQRAARRR